MGSIRFSVVIPTRGGASTLPATIRTCLDQDFDDYEVIVCDNDGPPEVKQAVDSVSTSRVRYVRSSRLLPMSENWDLAVAHARGEYVTVLGNDDGLLGHALAEVDRLIRETSAKAIRWERAQYMWPCHVSHADRNVFYIPLCRGRRMVDGRQAIRSVVAFQAAYTDLPGVYSGAVHHTLLDTLRTLGGGRLFPSRAPDVYSAFSLAYLAGNFLSVEIPMGINGGSGHSNGGAHLFPTRAPAIRSEFIRLNQEGQLHWDARVPPLPFLIEANVADAFQQARACVFPHDTELSLDRKELSRRCLQGIATDDPEQWHELISLIRQSLADDHDLAAWFDGIAPASPCLRQPPARVFSDFLGYSGEYIQLDTSRFGVQDIHGAAQLCENLLSYRRRGVNYGAALVCDIRDLERSYQLERTHLQGQIKTLDDRLNRTLEARVKRLFRSIPVLGPLARKLLRPRPVA
jgi:hypothetical protein